MKLSFEDPTSEPITIKITWNDVEVFRKDFAIGEIPAVTYDAPPNTSGVAQAYFIKDGVEIPAGSATYWAPDFKGAQMLVQRAKELEEEKKKPWQARTLLMEAVKIFEKLAPDCADIAGAYKSLWSICFLAKARPENRLRRRHEAIFWYEKEIALYERTGNLEQLGGSLINISALYGRIGDFDTALKRALKGLEITRGCDDSKDPEAIHAWTHCIGYLVKFKRFWKAEGLIAEGLARFPNDPSRAYLLNYQAEIFKARAAVLTAKAAALRKEAEEILPPNSCPL